MKIKYAILHFRIPGQKIEATLTNTPAIDKVYLYYEYKYSFVVTSEIDESSIYAAATVTLDGKDTVILSAPIAIGTIRKSGHLSADS